MPAVHVGTYFLCNAMVVTLLMWTATILSTTDMSQCCLPELFGSTLLCDTAWPDMDLTTSAPCVAHRAHCPMRTHSKVSYIFPLGGKHIMRCWQQNPTRSLEKVLPRRRWLTYSRFHSHNSHRHSHVSHCAALSTNPA